MEDGGWRIEDGGSRIEDRGSRMEDGGSRITADTITRSSIFYPRNLPVAQTDDDPDRVPEVIQHFISGPGSQVIYLTEANG
jgi:hypothetical protein